MKDFWRTLPKLDVSLLPLLPLLSLPSMLAKTRGDIDAGLGGDI